LVPPPDQATLVTGVLLPLAAPTAIAVDTLTKRTIGKLPAFVPCIRLYITRILLVALVGVIDTDKPVMSVNDVLPVVKVSVLVVLTTCNTEPVGNLADGNVPVVTVEALTVAI
jgi:hypothetical protein